MQTKKRLEKVDELIFKLYTRRDSIIGEANYVLEKDSIKEEENGIRLTIEEPVYQWTNNGRIDKNSKKTILITNKGEVEFLSEKQENIEEETIDQFLNKIVYKIEECTEDLIRMTKEQTSITYEVNNNSLHKVKTITPSIIYLNSFGQVLDIISLDKRPINKTKTYTK